MVASVGSMAEFLRFVDIMYGEGAHVVVDRVDDREEFVRAVPALVRWADGRGQPVLYQKVFWRFAGRMRFEEFDIVREMVDVRYRMWTFCLADSASRRNAMTEAGKFCDRDGDGRIRRRILDFFRDDVPEVISQHRPSIEDVLRRIGQLP